MNKKILITGGGCEESIDNVRCITNFSTGKTAAFLADFFSQGKNQVTLIMSERGQKPAFSEVKVLTYKSFFDLSTVLKNECQTKTYDVIIHAAAVSDYSPDTIQSDGKIFKAGTVEKLPSGSTLTITMKKNPKLVDSLKLWAGNSTKVVAFKLTSRASLEERSCAVQKIFSANKDYSLAPDFVVSNDKSEITAELHSCTIYSKDMNIVGKVLNLFELAKALEELF